MLQNTSACVSYVYWLATGTPSLTNTMQINPGQPFFTPYLPLSQERVATAAAPAVT
jgi:hypothetical protein